MNLNFVSQLIKENPWLLGAASLMGFGGIIASLRNIPMAIFELIKRKILVMVMVTDKYNSTYYLERAFSSNQKFVSKLKTVDCEVLPKEKDEHRINHFPGFGIHFVWYKYRMIWITRERSEAKGGWKQYNENWHFATIGTNPKILFDYINNLCNDYLSHKKPCIYLLEGSYWSKVNEISEKKFSSLVLEEKAKNIYSDVEKFFSRKKWYKENNIPFHRGYLLHGLPGTGKSSIVKALASDLRLDVYYINLNSKGLNDNELQKAMGNVVPNSIVLFEDIDCLFKKRKIKVKETDEKKDEDDEVPEESEDSEVTLSGLLNALDGFFASEGTLIFMTTNDKSKLDSALIRPGRIDYEVYFGEPSEYQIKNLFLKFYPESKLEYAESFARKILENDLKVSMAKLQGHFMMHLDEPKKCIENIEEMKEKDDIIC